jgi:hypothetical protein
MADAVKVLAGMLVMGRTCSCAFMDALDISWLQLLLESLQPISFQRLMLEHQYKAPSKDTLP